jgi:glucoamylase
MTKILLLTALLSFNAFASSGVTPNWSSARKIQVGTSFDSNSHVWFTNADGILTEVYFPTIDTAQIKDSQILVSDGNGFFVDEKYGSQHETNVLHPSLVEMSNLHSKFNISHKYFTVSNKNILVDEITVNAFEDGLDFYLLVNPALNNTGYFDSGQSHNDRLHFWEADTNLVVQSSINFLKTTIGYVGINDGHLDLRTDYVLNSDTNYLENGNIAGTAQLDIPKKSGQYKFYVTYAFNTKSNESASELAKSKNNYTSGWNKYFQTLNKPTFSSANQELLYKRSLYTLKVHEDKLNPGALIASLSKPWGEDVFEYPGVFTGGYHLVWPRDHYHVSLAMLMSGDLKTPVSALGFLKRIQYQSGEWNFNNERLIPKKGAFPQNAWTNLKEYWGGLQIDQVGYPIHLYWQVFNKLDKKGQNQLRKDFGQMVYDASEFIYNYGPWSAQERWEENFGISPSSFSVATSALKLASKILKDRKYDDKANEWLYKPNDNIHTWTHTTKGDYGDGRYYLRVSGCDSFLANWDPNNGAWCTIANSGQKIPMTKILDQGFLKLSLLGLVPASDERVKHSLKKVNDNIRVQFKNGFSGWYRYSYDAYGENKRGRLWPLLSGEHGRFAIERFTANDLSWKSAQLKVDKILKSYEYFANDGLMIPEQIFESSGKGTGAATPLAWSHAEFIKLLWSKHNKKNVENPFNI